MDYLDICLDLDKVNKILIQQFQKLLDEPIEETLFNNIIKGKNKNEKCKVSHILNIALVWLNKFHRNCQLLSFI